MRRNGSRESHGPRPFPVTGVGTGLFANKRGAGEQGNEMIAVYAGSFRLRLTRS